MLRDGPIPRFAHGLIEYVAGALLVVAPFLLGFDSGAAIAASIVIGVLVILVAAATEGPTSLVDSLQIQLHIALDYVLGAFLVASPFLFGFSDESTPTAFFIAIGVVHLLVTLGTRFLPRRERESSRSEAG
ncbi:MAG: hypothetical protein ABR581_01080 [Thermoleophilaceae bacterium]